MKWDLIIILDFCTTILDDLWPNFRESQMHFNKEFHLCQIKLSTKCIIKCYSIHQAFLKVWEIHCWKSNTNKIKPFPGIWLCVWNLMRWERYFFLNFQCINYLRLFFFQRYISRRTYHMTTFKTSLLVSIKNSTSYSNFQPSKKSRKPR